MSWGDALWDKFDIVEKHTEKGINFSRRVVQFFEEYAAKKHEHAQQMRKLVKHYNINYKKSALPVVAGVKKTSVSGDSSKEYSYETAFYVMLDHVYDMAHLDDTLASELEDKVIKSAKNTHNDFMSKRKQYLSAGRDHNVRLSNSLKFLETAESNFKKACKARDEAEAAFNKADNDMNVTKALVAKCEQTFKNKTDLMEVSRSEYIQQLKQTNEAQREHYNTQMPLVFSDLQQLDSDRIVDLQKLIHEFANLHHNYQPLVEKCLNGMHQCADDVQLEQDLGLVVTRHQTGNLPPPDRPYVDYSVNPNLPSSAELSSKRSPSSQRSSTAPPLPDSKTNTSTSIYSYEGGEQPTNNNNNNITSPTDTSMSTSSPPYPGAPDPSPLPVDPATSSTSSSIENKSITLAAPSTVPNANVKEKKKRRFLSFMSKKSKNGNSSIQKMLQQDFPDIPFVNDPPAQQRIKSEAKIVELEREIEKLEKEREGMLRLKSSYSSNTAYGDPKTLEPKLARVGQELDERRVELKRYSEFLTAVKLGGSVSVKHVKSSSSSAGGASSSHRMSQQNYHTTSESSYGDATNRYSGSGMSKMGGGVAISGAAGGRSCTMGGGLGVGRGDAALEVGSHQSHISNHSSEDFDYDDDDDDGNYSEIPEPAVGYEMYRNGENGGGEYLVHKCQVLYSYEKTTEAALSIIEGEVLDVIESDDGHSDGWTKVRRNNTRNNSSITDDTSTSPVFEEGYVPTSYIKAILDCPPSTTTPSTTVHHPYALTQPHPPLPPE